MVTMTQFRRLSVSKRAQLVWNRATFLACIDTNRAGRSLYYLYDYYVELIYDFDNNWVLGVFAFQDPWHVDDWLEKCDMEQFLSQ